LSALVMRGHQPISYALDALRDRLAPNSLHYVAHSFQVLSVFQSDLQWRPIADCIFHDELVGPPLMNIDCMSRLLNFDRTGRL
jgi:hypothetical protein